MKGKRRKHSSAFKAKVAIEALKERESLQELSHRFEVSQNQISKWKSEFLSKSSEVFEKSSKVDSSVDLSKLYAKIGELEMEKEFLKKNLKKLGLL